MYLYGAGGHAKVVAEIIRACGAAVDGCIDDDPAAAAFAGQPVLRSTEGRSPLIVTIGDNAARRRVATRLCCAFGRAFHPAAIISPTATIGEGTVVMAGVVINAEARVGRHCIVNTGATVDHECRLADFTHVSPHATLCGNVAVGEGAWIGAGAVVIQGVSVGSWSVVGAGAVVISDVPDHALVVGNPARVVRMFDEIITKINSGG